MLLEMASFLRKRYGSLETLYAQSKDSKDLEKKLKEFKGVGPTTVNIFLRELKGIWKKARPKISPLARQVASRLNLTNEQLQLPEIESALVRINLEFCKRKKCSSCPVREYCTEPVNVHK
jgi:endonuclease III